jgi:hypothetical protein
MIQRMRVFWPTSILLLAASDRLAHGRLVNYFVQS